MTKKQKALGNAKESGKIILKGFKEVGTGSAKVVGGTAKTLYHLIDAGDKAIGEKIEKKQLEKGKSPGKIKRFIRDNTIKGMIALSLMGYGAGKSYENFSEKQQDKMEININSDKIEESENSGLEIFEEREYFKNPDFFDKNFKVTKDSTYEDKGIILIRDAGFTFYVVKEGDSLSKIRNKLSKIPEFSYLSNSEYEVPDKGRNIHAFNVPSSVLVPGLYIPIPVKVSDREVSQNEFEHYTKVAIQEMKNDKIYGKDMKELLKTVGEKEIMDIMSAFARCETSEDWSEFSDPIGSVELHRWEQGSDKNPIKAFSFSYYHILMEMNGDGKTPGPGLKARLNLGLTEGQCYHPKNAGKLFLGYCFEKKKSDPSFFFRIKNLDDAKKVGKVYNGLSDYGNKLWANIQHIKGK